MKTAPRNAQIGSDFVKAIRKPAFNDAESATNCDFMILQGTDRTAIARQPTPE